MVGFSQAAWVPRSCSVLALLNVLLLSGGARAQSNAATAEALFRQGRDLLRAGNAREACPKLEESQRLDPATGTLLALAMCHEAEGKLASAWAEYVAVEARARNEGRTDREKVARTHAEELKKRLSSLEIRVPTEVASLSGLQIRWAGVELGTGAWNVAVPIDGGEHRIEVTAPGKETWQASVTVKNEGDVAVLEVPPLRAARPNVSAEGKPRSRAMDKDPRPNQPGRSGQWGTLEWTGLGVASAGAVSLGVGGYFLSAALGDKSESNRDCEGNLCGPQGYERRQQAVSKGNTATFLGVAGGALLAGGVALIVIGRFSGSSKQEGEAMARLRSLSVDAHRHGVGATFSSDF